MTNFHANLSVFSKKIEPKIIKELAGLSEIYLEAQGQSKLAKLPSKRVRKHIGRLSNGSRNKNPGTVFFCVRAADCANGWKYTHSVGECWKYGKREHKTENWCTKRQRKVAHVVSPSNT